MATKNPRVVSYVSPENHARLKKYVQQQGLTESKAIDAILNEFFSTASSVISSTDSSTLKQVLDRIATLEQQMSEAMGEFAA